jgi:tetratricopeptide (TPR) repeat protein
MNVVEADFNELTEKELICLGSPWSMRCIEREHRKPGDWVWLADGELRVGARIEEDPRYRLVGVPSWDTLVYFEDEDDRDFHSLWDEFAALLRVPRRAPEMESRLLQLLTWIEAKAPPALGQANPGYLDRRRAFALLALGHPELALDAAEDAVAASPESSESVFLLLDLLRRTDPPRALSEAERRMGSPSLTAQVVAACVNILAAHADRVEGPAFTPACRGVLDWCARFENAPERDRVRAATLGSVRFNQGFAHLGLGEVDEARRSFQEAQAAYPFEHGIDEALQLGSYGVKAQKIAADLRDRTPTVAA